MPAEVTTIQFDRIYKSSHFPEGSVLSSDTLNLFQDKFKIALDKIVQAIMNNVNWVVIDSKADLPASKLWLDAIFTEDKATDPNDSTFYSHGHGGRSTSSLPNFPQYFTFISGDRIYFGDKLPFRQLDIDLITVASATISPTFEYWDGSSWTAISGLVDNTTGLTGDGSLVFTIPSDWSFSDLDTILSLTDFSIDTRKRFWIRIVAGASPATPPKIQQVDRNNIPFEDSCKVIPQGTPDLTVIIEPGVAIVDNQIVVVGNRQTLDLSSQVPGSDSRKICVQLNSEGTIGTIIGSIAASPISPEPNKNAIKLADITIATGASTIVGGNIDDSRIQYDPSFTW